MIKGLKKSRTKLESMLSECSQGPGFLNEILPSILKYHHSHLGLDVGKLLPQGRELPPWEAFRG